MRYLFQEYGGVIINSIVASMLIILFFSQLYPAISNALSNTLESTVVPKNIVLNDVSGAPTLIVSSCVITKDSQFDYHNYVSAYTQDGNNISNEIEIVKGSVDTSTVGQYEVTFKVSYKGISTYHIGVFLVEG